MNVEGEGGVAAGIGAGEGDEAVRHVFGEIDGHLFCALSRLDESTVRNGPVDVRQAGKRINEIVVGTTNANVFQSVNAVHVVNVRCH